VRAPTHSPVGQPAAQPGRQGGRSSRLGVFLFLGACRLVSFVRLRLVVNVWPACFMCKC